MGKDKENPFLFVSADVGITRIPRFLGGLEKTRSLLSRLKDSVPKLGEYTVELESGHTSTASSVPAGCRRGALWAI